ncbi:RNA polymerase-associated protein RapA [Pseudomonas fluorescens]|uniref:RNA polymerase-associated protein RapA n=1 Tax=Pseudomonas fluorescens TaxID=294 RepID=A0A5E7TW57_PSEFL|nr:SNF2-related protein [Pseudomonas fluorescens]VVQ02631.1 RNA polymerase-associated protein RapA [Pseudomonas fluorescens]
MKLSVSDVRGFLDFSCKNQFGASESMIDLQVEGVAALCNILKRESVAYLADEVGLGKTMQALGVIGQLLRRKPKARVLIISPRENVQLGWAREFERFRAHVWTDPACTLAPLQMYGSLREWLGNLPGGPSIALLRHPSFTRPVYVGESQDWGDAVQRLALEHITLPRKVPEGKAAERSRDFNLHFAKAVNAWLHTENIEFDLVVVDEAQCLRNPSNQTNSVLQSLLKTRVKQWLFMSATPAHSGVDNIATVLNDYPDRGALIETTQLTAPDNHAAMKTLARFMIRRPRRYVVAGKALNKGDYRKDDQTTLSLSCKSSLDLLSIALVQKRLVDVLDARGNRFRSGYMASFESLEDSLKSRATVTLNKAPDDLDEEPEQGDFHFDTNVRLDDSQSPDAGFVSALSRDFVENFAFDLPHPKIDAVAQDLALTAFGIQGHQRMQVGGVKTLVFCRRISSVHTLRQRLMQQYNISIEVRSRDYWKQRLDWERGFTGKKAGPADQEADSEFSGEPYDEGDGTNKLRVALRPKSWLRNFQSTFQDGQRNALFFEHNWFVRLCHEGGVEPREACEQIPPTLWAQSFEFATRGNKRYRRSQFRYLLWQCLCNHSQAVFGLNSEAAEHWQNALEPLFPEVHQPIEGEALKHHETDPDLLCFTSLWSYVECHTQDRALVLPGAGMHPNTTEILWRQILGHVLAQYLRLSDGLVDLYWADHRAKKQKQGTLLEPFVEWLLSTDSDAQRLRNVWGAWVKDHVLIFSSAIGISPGCSIDKLLILARQEDFDFLHQMDPVVGITGNSKGHKRPIQQFNTPGLPYVMVGTDTIREGVNLHLYCDRVMHYGVAWTPGDLEQRIGRVDRYFSQIERRLNCADTEKSPKLEVHYPHLRDTLERQQIEILLERKRRTDEVVDPVFDVGQGATGSGEIQQGLPVGWESNPVVSVAAGFFSTARHLPKEG